MNQNPPNILWVSKAIILSLLFLVGCNDFGKSIDKNYVEPDVPIYEDDGDPAWSHDGRYIAYTYYRISSDRQHTSGFQIWLYDVSNDSNYQFINHGFIPRWGAGDSVLAFVYPYGGFGDIWFYYFDRDTLMQITHNGWQANYDFSPEGKSLVAHNHYYDLSLFDSQGNFYKNLIGDNISVYMPRWSSPSGNILYYMIHNWNNPGIDYQFAISDSNGNFLGYIQDTNWFQYSSCWGPGDSLVIISDGLEAIYWPSHLWLKNRNSGQFGLLTTGWFPDWSYDGQWIAFADRSENPTRFTIWVARPDGSERREVSHWYPDNDTLIINNSSYPRCVLTEEQKARLKEN